MSMQFKVFGPFEISCDKAPKGSSKIITSEHIRDFWASNAVAEFSGKTGCYVFSVRAGKGHTPWYVGKANGVKGFLQEVFTDSKIKKYNEVLFKGKKGTPVMFFIVNTEKKKEIPADIVSDLEDFLIQVAVAKNPDCKNIQGRKKIQPWNIDGVLPAKQGGGSQQAKVFKKMMGIQ